MFPPISRSLGHCPRNLAKAAGLLRGMQWTPNAGSVRQTPDPAQPDGPPIIVRAVSLQTWVAPFANLASKFAFNGNIGATSMTGSAESGSGKPFAALEIERDL